MATTSDDDRLLATQNDAESHVPPPPVATARRLRPFWPVRFTRSRRTIVTVLLLLLACLLLLAGGLVASGSLAVFPSSATVTLTPLSRIERQTVTVQAVTGTPARGQAQARVLEARPSPQHTTAPATGNVHLAAASAHGAVTFYNLATYAIWVPAGVPLTGSDKVTVITDAAVTVPAGNPPLLGSATVTAHAQNAGPDGNIAAGDIDVLCCANGIVAKNAGPFTGGQNARSFTDVQQQDVQSAAAPLEAALTQQAHTSLEAQLRPQEQLLQPRCTADVRATPPVGHEATQVTVAVAVTCRSEAYDGQQIARLATASFQQQMRAALGPAFVLSGQMTAASAQVAVTNAARGALSIAVPLSGVWVYHIDRAGFRTLQQQIAGKDIPTAQALLLRVPGIAHAAIQLSGWNNHTLPTDANQIAIQLMLPRTP